MRFQTFKIIPYISPFSRKKNKTMSSVSALPHTEKCLLLHEANRTEKQIKTFFCFYKHKAPKIPSGINYLATFILTFLLPFLPRSLYFSLILQITLYLSPIHPFIHPSIFIEYSPCSNQCVEMHI